MKRDDKRTTFAELAHVEITCDCGADAYIEEDEPRTCRHCGREWWYEVTVFGPAREVAKEAT